MKKKNTYAIFGLGRFGFTLAKELSKLNQDVIAVDQDLDLVNMADDFCTALSFDMTNIEDMRKAGIQDVNTAIVATGSSLEDSILATINLKELGVETVIAKAKNEKHALALSRVGADRVVLPESDVAKRLAYKQALGKGLVEVFNLGDQNTVFEAQIKKEWIGKNLIEINPRLKYNVNVIALKRDNDFKINLDPKENFKEGDVIVAISSNKDFEKFIKR